MKRRELFWMIAPCLLLIGAGTYFTQRPTPFVADAGLWRLSIAKIERKPLLPREVAAGFDTKCEITFAESGARPLERGKPLNIAYVTESLSVVRRSDGKKVPVPLKFEPSYTQSS